MSSGRFTRDEMRTQLATMRFSPDAIEAALDREYGPAVALRMTPVAAEPARQAVALPFFLVVPWSQLCSDNDKDEGSLRMTADGPRPGKKLTERYTTSKANIAARARSNAGDVAPSTAPLAIAVDVWVPPARRNDAINFAKVVGDALEGIVYANDNQLHDSRWRRRGVDIDAPRAEITISLLPD